MFAWSVPLKYLARKQYICDSKAHVNVSRPKRETVALVKLSDLGKGKPRAGNDVVMHTPGLVVVQKEDAQVHKFQNQYSEKPLAKCASCRSPSAALITSAAPCNRTLEQVNVSDQTPYLTMPCRAQTSMYYQRTRARGTYIEKKIIIRVSSRAQAMQSRLEQRDCPNTQREALLAQSGVFGIILISSSR